MDPTIVTTVTTVISTVGFPIFVACWLLFRTDKTLAALTIAINELTRVVSSVDVKAKNNG